ncbi:hypothetical protein JCM17204_17090 [Blautia stercoris]
MRKLDMMYLKTKQMVTNFFYDEQGDVNIVSMVVLIGVAVLAAVLFKSKIKNLIDTLFNKIGGNADGAVNAPL